MTRPQRGVALLEGLIALAVLSFGILGLARFQVGLLKQTTDARERAQAAVLADELLAYVRSDAANAACYTVPQAGTCGSTSAIDLTSRWTARVTAAHFAMPVASLPSGNRFSASISWTSRAFNETRTHEVSTDVRP